MAKCINSTAGTEFDKKENNQKPKNFLILLNAMSSFSKIIFLEKILVLCYCEGKAKDNVFKRMWKK